MLSVCEYNGLYERILFDYTDFYINVWNAKAQTPRWLKNRIFSNYHLWWVYCQLDLSYVFICHSKLKKKTYPLRQLRQGKLYIEVICDRKFLFLPITWNFLFERCNLLEQRDKHKLHDPSCVWILINELYPLRILDPA